MRTVVASPADRFIGSLGLNTHWSYDNTPYGAAYDAVLGRLRDLGIRHVRDGFNRRVADLAKYGITTDIIVSPGDGTPSAIRDRIRALNRNHLAVDAVEGPNEADLTWKKSSPPVTYLGKGFPDGVVDFQRAIFAVIKGDPATARIAVIGPSLGRTYNPGADFPNPFADGALTSSVDWGNFHPYPFGGNPFSPTFPYGSIRNYYHEGNFPSVNLDEYPYAFKVYAPPFGGKPMVATETGYATFRGSPFERVGGVSETVQAKYVPRLYCEYYRLGILRTYLYEFVDERPDPSSTDREAHFGLLRHDLSPKPAYLALRSLIHIVADDEAGPDAEMPPGSLQFTLRPVFPPGYDRARYIHQLLLQKKNGARLLLLWHEIANSDISTRPPREISPPPVTATLTFMESPRNLIQYEYGTDWNLRPRALHPEGRIVKISIPDTVTILRIGD